MLFTTLSTIWIAKARWFRVTLHLLGSSIQHYQLNWYSDILSMNCNLILNYLMRIGHILINDHAIIGWISESWYFMAGTVMSQFLDRLLRSPEIEYYVIIVNKSNMACILLLLIQYLIHTANMQLNLSWVDIIVYCHLIVQ